MEVQLFFAKGGSTRLQVVNPKKSYITFNDAFGVSSLMRHLEHWAIEYKSSSSGKPS